MRKLALTTVLVMVVLLSSTAGQTAQASSTSILRLAHKPWAQMTRQQKINYLKRQRFHDHSIVRFWHNHPGLMTWRARSDVHWAQQSLKIVKHNLNKLTYVSHVVSGNVSGLLCIHGHEGAWDDPSPPYWGGLQMDLNFQKAYGPEFLRLWGTADHWPIWAQLQAGLRAVKVRGYNPWPNTARRCGLL